jgi:hypothetical protein
MLRIFIDEMLTTNQKSTFSKILKTVEVDKELKSV